ncbi:MAG: hypothetical protein NTU51_10610 [Bacteroidetes bacterium]|nr:hypothetical protein [Bacteroidota bacterium]
MKQLTWGLILVVVLLLLSCSTSRQMQKQRQESKIDCTAVEKQVRHNDIETDTKSQLTSTTETTETIDTVVTVADPKTRQFLQVPIRMKRVIKSQQYSSTQSATRDKSQLTDEKTIHEKKAVLNETKVVKTQRPNLTLYIVIAISVLIVLLFVFLWKRNLFARFFDVFRR